MSAASIAVRVAAWSLPRRMRDRYREQWLADLLDAEEAGIRPSAIAIGSLAFAVTLARPITTGPQMPYEVTVARRARLASALALSCAVIAMSLFANLGGGYSLSGNGIYDFIVVFLGPGLLLLYFVFALFVSFALMAVTRGIPARIRWAVLLLTAASLSGFTHPLIYSLIPPVADADVVLVRGLTFAISLALSLSAGILLLRHFRRRNRYRPPFRTRVLGALTGAGVPLVAVGLGVAHLLVLRSALRDSDLAYLDGFLTRSPHEVGRIAFRMVESSYATVDAIVFWGVISALACAVVGAAGYLWPRYAVARTSAVLCAVLISHAGVLDLVWLFSFGGSDVHSAVPEEVLLLGGQWGLVAIILHSVGGLRLAGVRGRHDAEGVIASS